MEFVPTEKTPGAATPDVLNNWDDTLIHYQPTHLLYHPRLSHAR
nr:MAG TPA: hypothetical protein [Caudoviricetes sp.]